MTTISLGCQCGAVAGTATNVTPSSGTRVICCCSDCQTFAVHLGQEAKTLDEFGGTEIFQMSQSQLSIQKGQDNLRSMRLTKKGLLRWYTSCCNTPIGTTVSAKIPFVGVTHNFINASDRDAVLGPVRSVVQTQHAIGTPNYPRHSARFPLGITARIIRKMLMWRIQGKHKPSVFFGNDGRPVVRPMVLQPDDPPPKL